MWSVINCRERVEKRVLQSAAGVSLDGKKKQTKVDSRCLHEQWMRYYSDSLTLHEPSSDWT